MPDIDHGMGVFSSTRPGALEGRGPSVGFWGSEGSDGLGGKKPLPGWIGPSSPRRAIQLRPRPSFSWAGPCLGEFDQLETSHSFPGLKRARQGELEVLWGQGLECGHWQPPDLV